MNLLSFKTANLPHLIDRIACLLFLCGLVLLTGCKKNLEQIRAGKVVGGSMAPSFIGEHVFFECDTCHLAVTADLEQSKNRERLICPNCGASTHRQDCERGAADSVEIAVGAPVDRWDVIAFRMPDSTDSAVKRVVGLPGEKIEIRNGNLFANGRLLRKSIETQRSMRVLVHDSNYTDSNSDRWIPINPSDKFEIKNGLFQFGNSSGKPGDICWVEYRHQPCYSRRPSAKSAPGQVPIEDDYGYNQSLSRDLNPISDIYLEFVAESPPNSKMYWMVLHQFGEFVFAVDVDKRQLRITNQERPELIIELEDSCFSKPGVRIEFSCFDDQFFVVLNGQKVHQHSFDQPMPEQGTEFRPTQFQFGSTGKLTINRIRIWRDLYYLAADGMPGSTQTISSTQMGYVLLGDNVPISVDSRHWDIPTISSKQIIGRLSGKTK